MTDWTLLAVQSIGVLLLTFFFCRSSYRDGYKRGLRDGFMAQHRPVDLGPAPQSDPRGEHHE